MSILTGPQKTRLRQAVASDTPSQDWVKITMDNSMQGMDDWWDTVNLTGVINSVAAPHIFSASEIESIQNQWLKSKADRGI